MRGWAGFWIMAGLESLGWFYYKAKKYEADSKKRR